MEPSTPISQPSTAELPGWDCPLIPVICPKCDARFLIPLNGSQKICPACFTADLQPQIDFSIPEPPELFLPFKISREALSISLENWLKGVWFPAGDLQPSRLVSRLVPCYLPMRLVDGAVSGTWQAQAGFDYQVASSHDSYQNDRWTSQQTAETRVRWEPRRGQVDRGYQNLAVPCLEDHARLLQGLGGYQYQNAQPYTAQAIQSVSVRLPDYPAEKSWAFAKSQFDRAVSADCQTACAAQHIEQVQLQADYQKLNWTVLLLPVYASFYADDDDKVFPVLIHGQSGQIFGERRASQSRGLRWTGTLLGAALTCFILAVLLGLAVAVFPILAVINVILIGLAIFLGLISPAPAVWAWQFNRKSTQSQR